MFAASCDALQKDLKSRAEGDHLVWDKDEKSAMDFVTACANIRAHIFNIPLKSRFEIKCKYAFHIKQSVEWAIKLVFDDFCY